MRHAARRINKISSSLKINEWTHAFIKTIRSKWPSAFTLRFLETPSPLYNGNHVTRVILLQSSAHGET